MVPECSCDAAQLKRPHQGRRTKHADEGRALTTSQGRAARVFVNCPFDDDYVCVFRAIVFAIHDLGFQARRAQIDDGEVVHVQRIHAESKGSLYSTRDISQVEPGGTLQLPRFNMPFEPGIARSMHAAGRPLHHMLLLEKEPNLHNASMSDAAGMDAKIHAGEPALAFEAVRAFFRTKSDTGRPMRGGENIAKRYALFEAKLPASAAAAKISKKEVRS